MRRMIENCFEIVEANVGYALFAITVSFTLAGCFRLLLE